MLQQQQQFNEILAWHVARPLIAFQRYLQQVTPLIEERQRESAVTTVQALSALADEIAKRWESMVAREQRYEARTGDRGRQGAALLEEDELVAAAVEGEGRTRHARCDVLHVEGEHGAQVPLRHLGGGRHALPLVECLPLRLCGLSHELGDEYLAQCRAPRAPAQAGALEEHVGLFE